MGGFFKKEETKSLRTAQSKPASCVTCGLYKDIISPKMEPYGNFKKNIMVIGEAPGETEDRKGKPWQGKAGRMLAGSFRELGVDLFEDCVSLNSVNCRPPENRAPSNNEINFCRDIKVLKAIEEYKPDMIILLGAGALTSFLGHRWKKNLGGISKWRGWTIPDKDFKAWVCPTFHPSYVERMNSTEVKTVWRQDLARAFELIGKPLPRFPKPKIHYLSDLSELPELSRGMIAFDYETTGLKPHSAGHRIICAAVAIDEETVYTFMLPEKKKEWAPLVALLENPAVSKIAANMKFEDHWSLLRLGVEVRSWIWDTMQAAHILDNRRGVTGLKFQAYVRLGVVDYDSEVSSYLKPKDNRANSINQIGNLLKRLDGPHQLLEYCALDALYEYRIGVMQMTELDYNFLPF